MQATALQLQELARRAILRLGVLTAQANALEANWPLSGRFKVADVPRLRARAARLQRACYRLRCAAAAEAGGKTTIFRLDDDPRPQLPTNLVLVVPGRQPLQNRQ